MKPSTESVAKQYVPQRRWLCFCSENELDPPNSDVISGAVFKNQYFRKSICEYSSLYQFSSSQGFTFGEWLLIKRLSRGMFKERQTFALGIGTYNVKYVLD